MKTVTGWGAIASYIGRSVSAAQRYERTLELPVRRSGHGSKPPVYALASDLDTWLRQFRSTPGIREVAAPHSEHGQHPLDAELMQRVRSLSDVALYRRDYHLQFSLSAARVGVRINLELAFDLVNASDDVQPYVQELTIDDVERGRVKEMAFFKDGKPFQNVNTPPKASQESGYSLYRGREVLIGPHNAAARYSCRSSWEIHRQTEDFWYNHMALPTFGVHIETKAPPQYTITPSYSESRLVLKGEHLDISWRLLW